jgi:hypothetical protein
MDRGEISGSPKIRAVALTAGLLPWSFSEEAATAKPIDLLDPRHVGQSCYSAHTRHAHQPPGASVSELTAS